MQVQTIKAMMDACYQAKRIRDLLPQLPKGITSSYIIYLDVIETLEKKGHQVKISDISDTLNIPRPGVTRTVKNMQCKRYIYKYASEHDGRITYLRSTENEKIFLCYSCILYALGYCMFFKRYSQS